MNLMLNLGILIVLTCLAKITPTEICCRRNSINFHQHLATKTAYRFVANVEDSNIKYPGCEPVKIWALIRHGTRYPSNKLIVKINQRLTVLRDSILSNADKGNLCPEVLDSFKKWKPMVELEDEKRLTHEGEEEMIELAERLQNRFPDLLQTEYSNKTYKFRHTATQRTRECQKYFTIGLFGKKVSNYVWSPEPLARDPILRFYKLCQKWRLEVDKNPLAVIERRKFQNSSQFIEMVKTVSNCMGLNHRLSADDIHTMYMTCAFETAWKRQYSSPWCGVFTEQDLTLLEYSEDLEYYWVDGYGYDINHEQACPLLTDMFEHMLSRNGTHPRTFYFTHSGTILKFLAHLGLYKDDGKLKHDRINVDRLWRVGKIDAFASNLVFVLFDCEDGLKLLTLHQENIIHLPCCSQKEPLCQLETIINYYSHSFDKCHFQTMCAN